MYKLNEIRVIHFEPTSKCQASCPMCSRNFHGGITNPFIEITEINYDEFTKWLPPTFIAQLHKFYMCGNVGEPTLAKDTMQIFEYVINNNNLIQLSMNTNGSARDKQWWYNLGKLFSANGNVRFGIDGLENTHHLYRVGTDWNKIIKNATSYITSGGNAIWDMLVFDHNKHQVDECRKLSEDLGFISFNAKHTSRFKEDKIHVLTRKGTTSHYIHPSEKSKNFTEKFQKYTIETNKEIHCKVAREKNLYINAHGNVFPCCWLDMDALSPISLSRVDYLDRKLPIYSLKHQSLENIFNTDYFQQIENTWINNPLRECSKQCGKIDKFNEQF